MPLKVYPPRKGRSENCRIRGTYLGIYVDRSARTPKRAVANKKRKAIEAEIERGEFSESGAVTFLEATRKYLKAGGEKTYLKAIVGPLGPKPLYTTDWQTEADSIAAELYPPGIDHEPTPHNSNINRVIHTPISAVLKFAGHPVMLRRPKMPKARPRWITPQDAEKWLAVCSSKLRRLSIFLLYTGCRLGEALSLTGRNFSVDRKLAFIEDTKNGESRAVHLPATVINEMGEIHLTPDQLVFGYLTRWHVYDEWAPLRDDLEFPKWWTPHACCHTWATWMRQYAGQDIRGLLGTGRWKDLKSVLVYQHVETSVESRAADLLPDVAGKKSVESGPDPKESAA